MAGREKHDPARIAARNAGARYYHGSPCSTCGTTRRYTSSKVCVACQTAHNHCLHAPNEMRRPPQSVLDERDRRLAQPETLAMRLFGDPPPGRSALDQRKGVPP